MITGVYSIGYFDRMAYNASKVRRIAEIATLISRGIGYGPHPFSPLVA